MKILIPFNTTYLNERYLMSEVFLEKVREEVLPYLIARLSADSRVSSIEVMADRGPPAEKISGDKITINQHDIGPHSDLPTVIDALLKHRSSKSDVIVTVNPLYPLVRISSLERAFQGVNAGHANSAFGSIMDKVGVTDPDSLEELDQGVFAIFRETDFATTKSRINPNVDVIGLSALELVCLRTEKDLELYDLIVNSGYPL